MPEGMLATQVHGEWILEQSCCESWTAEVSKMETSFSKQQCIAVG